MPLVQAQALTAFRDAEFHPKAHLLYKGFTYPNEPTASNVSVKVTAPAGVIVAKGAHARTFEATHTPKDKLEHLHEALVTDVTTIRVPKNAKITESIRITLSGTLDSSVRASFHHVTAIVEDGASASFVIENTIHSNSKDAKTEPVYVSDVFEILPGANSVVDVYNVNEPGDNILLFSRRLAKPAAHAQVNWYSGVFGSKATNMVVQTQYTQSGAHGKNLIAFFGENHERLELWANALHQAPHTANGILCKGALSGHSESTFEGFVKIEKNAPGTVSGQSERVILLSETAWANAIPALVIENNDVQANHAAAVGQVSEDQLYYLMSRGLSREEAFQMILEGFFEPIVSAFPDELVAKRVRGKVQERLERSISTG